MSLESNIKRIADSLEIIAKCMSNPQVEAPQPAAAPAQTVAPAPLAQQTVAVPPAHIPPQNVPAPPQNVPAPPQPAAPVAAPVAAPAVTAMTDDDLNKALVVEFNRLGKREAIDQAMAQTGITSCRGLSGEQQQALLAAVRALQP